MGMVTASSVPVLERTLATTFVPGSNRRGEALGAAWTLLLDHLDLGHVVCLGVPGERSLRSLARHARAVTLVCADRRASRLVRRRLLGPEFEGVASVPAADVGNLGSVDLTVVTSARWARRAAADAQLRSVLLRSVAVYAQLGVHDRAVPLARPSVALWLGMADGEVSLAAGLRDDAAIALLRRPGAASVAAPRRPSASGLARQVRQRPRLREHVGTLAGLGSPSPGTGVPVPAYVRDIAEAAGERVDGFRVALTAPGDYPSRKPVLALFAPGARSPRYVVKLAHDVALNDRLENETRALRTLAALGIGDAATVPRAAFVGQHAGHAVLGQTAIIGVPFRQATSATPDCPAARAAIAWLTELGARTADRTVAEPAQVAAALGELLERFVHVYRPTVAEREALASQIAAIAASRRPFPVVFQHGDAGTWNLLVTTDGRPAFLDWEAAEAHGMPLWDLFYFARSVAVGVARASGTRGSLEAFAREFLPDGPMSRTLGQDLGRHAAQIGLDPALVEPLLLTCWMHRALKEATTLRPAHLARGRYVRLLRLCLQHRDAPGLRRLCGRDQDGAQRRP
jgi:aminoglycoside phosphotransferase (APT) family kinase protein